jgi:hypothetical protein
MALAAFLPEVAVTGLREPVVRVTDEQTREVVYALRLAGDHFRPHVFRTGTYTVEVGEPGTSRWKVFRSISAGDAPQPALRVDF